MMGLAPTALAPETVSPSARIFKEPVGVVLLIAPWNYPLLTAVNSLVPAILAGNAVLIKHSPRSPQCADILASAFTAAGVPKGLVSAIHCTDDQIQGLIDNPSIQFVSFTGSVEVGHKVYRSVAQKRFIDCTLELGGKDAAYVAADADLDHAVLVGDHEALHQRLVNRDVICELHTTSISNRDPRGIGANYFSAKTVCMQKF